MRKAEEAAELIRIAIDSGLPTKWRLDPEEEREMVETIDYC